MSSSQPVPFLLPALSLQPEGWVPLWGGRCLCIICPDAPVGARPSTAGPQPVRSRRRSPSQWSRPSLPARATSLVLVLRVPPGVGPRLRGGSPRLGPGPWKAPLAALWHWCHFKGSTHRARPETEGGLDSLVDCHIPIKNNCVHVEGVSLRAGGRERRGGDSSRVRCGRPHCEEAAGLRGAGGRGVLREDS